jgi:hypothetical protein
MVHVRLPAAGAQSRTYSLYNIYISPQAGEREREREAYQDVDERGKNNGAVAPQKRISHKCAQQRQQLRRSGPRVDVLGRRGRGLPQ